MLLLIVTQTSTAQIPEKGFFIGGSGTLLMMNGKGEVEDEDFDVTDELFVMDVTETSTRLNVEWEYPGWSWGNRFLYGLKPVVGYRLSPQMALIGSYSLYMTKKSDLSDSHSGSGNFSGIEISTEAENEYTQRVMQLLVQYHLTPGKELFLIGGMEFVSLKAEQQFTWTARDSWGTDVDEYEADGSESLNGLVVGLGIEKPLQSGQNMALVASAMYSFAKYDGDELLESDNGVGEELEFGVGGFMANIGIRMYFNNEPAPQQ